MLAFEYPIWPFTSGRRSSPFSRHRVGVAGRWTRRHAAPRRRLAVSSFSRLDLFWRFGRPGFWGHDDGRRRRRRSRANPRPLSSNGKSTEILSPIFLAILNRASSCRANPRIHPLNTTEGTFCVIDGSRGASCPCACPARALSTSAAPHARVYSKSARLTCRTLRIRKRF